MTEAEKRKNLISLLVGIILVALAAFVGAILYLVNKTKNIFNR